MKKLFLVLVFPFIVHAETYVHAGGNNSVVHLVAAQVLQKAYTRSNLKMKAIYIPLEKALELSNSGQIDGELARIEKISKTYKNLRIVPVGIINVEAIAFSKFNNVRINEWSDLRDYKITVVNGTKFIETATIGYKRKIVKTFEEAFAQLINDETDIVVIQKLAGIKMLHERRFKDVHAISSSLQTLKLYHFVHKKNAHLIPILTPVLKEMEKSGEISYLKQAYLRSLTPH